MSEYDRAAKALHEHLHPAPKSHKGTHPGGQFSNRAKCEYDGPIHECPACYPVGYAKNKALHRHYFSTEGFNLVDGLRLLDGTYLGRVVGPHHHVDKDRYPLGWAVGTSSEEALATLADLFPENNYFVLPEAVLG